jgi:hypothetical protein
VQHSLQTHFKGSLGLERHQVIFSVDKRHGRLLVVSGVMSLMSEGGKKRRHVQVYRAIDFTASPLAGIINEFVPCPTEQPCGAVG